MRADDERDRDREAAEVYALLRHLDHPAPHIDAEAIAAQAGSARVRWPRWAAAVFVALGLAGVAYAAPGSPLPSWTNAVLGWLEDRPEASESAPGVPASDSVVSGIAVVPGRELTIVFTASQADKEARVSLTDGTEVVVRALGGPATFTFELDRLEIDNQGSPANFAVQIPRAALRVEIRVGAERIFLKEGARVAAERHIDAGQSYLLPLAPPGS